MNNDETGEREEILARTNRLQMSPWEAEKWAHERGKEPFARKLGPDDFDPMQQAMWTLPMAAAWLIWRSPDAVRDHWDEYRRQWTVWRRIPTTPGRMDQFTCELVPIGPANLRRMFACPDIRIFPGIRSWDYESPYDRVPSVKASGDTFPRQTLSSALSRRSVGATGILWNDKSKARAAVPRTFLHAYYRYLARGAKLTDDDKENSAFVVSTDNPRLLYENICVERSKVIAADEKASAKEFQRPEWLTEHVLGWIAYRNPKRFRPLARDMELRRNVGYPTYPFDFRNGDPAGALGRALADGTLAARPTTETLEVGIMDPIPAEWWCGRGLSRAPDLWFQKDAVLNLWPTDEDETALMKSSQGKEKSVQKPLPRMQKFVLAIARELWPNGDINMPRISDRDNEIIKHFKSKKLHPPSPKTIKRAFDSSWDLD
jgi:hypothetical protein